MGGSPAIDKGSNIGSTTDQRGLARPFDDPGNPNAAGGNDTDIGAFEVQTPTAAGVSVGGRVLNEAGRGISRAIVYATDQNGTTRTARTKSFGNFLFADLPAGQTYIFTVFTKQYQFDPQVITVNENVSDLNFTPQSAGFKR
jgi:hypothetical protein